MTSLDGTQVRYMVKREAPGVEKRKRKLRVRGTLEKRKPTRWKILPDWN